MTPNTFSMLSRLLKGWIGEKVSGLDLWFNLDPREFQRFHGLTVDVGSGSTQIDHVVAAVSGIFVVETKNYSGLILGGADEPHWTQVLLLGHNRFQNPLFQNRRHIRVLSQALELPEGAFLSVVAFVGPCILGNPLPRNVIHGGPSSYIASCTGPRLTSAQVDRACRKLAWLQANPAAGQLTHILALQKRHTSYGPCPRCGGRLVIRVPRAGGHEFLGCTRFPHCRFTMNFSR